MVIAIGSQPHSPPERVGRDGPGKLFPPSLPDQKPQSLARFLGVSSSTTAESLRALHDPERNTERARLISETVSEITKGGNDYRLILPTMARTKVPSRAQTIRASTATPTRASSHPLTWTAML
jgi:hypothetical protein